MTVPTRIVSDGGSSALNVSASVNLFTGVGSVYKIIVVTAPGSSATIIDSADTSATVDNTILTIPSTAVVGQIYSIIWPCIQGLSVVPDGTAVLSVSYSSGNQG